MVSAGGKVFASDVNDVINGTIQRPLCVLRKSTVTSIANNSVTSLTWDTEDVDTAGWHSTSSNTSRITPNKAGWIRFTGTITFASNAAGRRGLVLRFNGTSTWWGATFFSGVAANITVTLTVTVPANGSTDYFELGAFQDSGGSLNTADTTTTRFEAEWIRDL